MDIEIPMASESIDIPQFIQKEKDKYLKRLEKTLEIDHEYKELKSFINEHPEKERNLSIIAKKYNMDTSLLKNNCLEINDNNSFTTKHQSVEHSSMWSESKSSNPKSTLYSTSVRHDRYKAMGLDENTKNEYFKNLKVIKKLQTEK